MALKYCNCADSVAINKVSFSETTPVIFAACSNASIAVLGLDSIGTGDLASVDAKEQMTKLQACLQSIIKPAAVTRSDVKSNVGTKPLYYNQGDAFQPQEPMG